MVTCFCMCDARKFLTYPNVFISQMSRNDKHERLIEAARIIVISISMQSLILHMTVYPCRYSAPVTIKKISHPQMTYLLIQRNMFLLVVLISLLGAATLHDLKLATADSNR